MPDKAIVVYNHSEGIIYQFSCDLMEKSPNSTCEGFINFFDRATEYAGKRSP